MNNLANDIFNIIKELSNQCENYIEEFENIFSENEAVTANYITIFYNCKDTQDYYVRRMFVKSLDDFWNKWNRFKKLKGFI